jgi:SET domain-containing protein
MILEKNINIEIRKSILHGWGVFAINDISKDTLLEECHGLFLSGDEFKKIKDIPGIGCNSFTISKDEVMLPYGYGAIYNSRKDNTVIIKFNKEKRTLDFYTAEDIKAHEELFLNYELSRRIYKANGVEI